MPPLTAPGSASPDSHASMAAPKSAAANGKALASKTHRRSRSGCFTCRLRRKKCEESKPACKACRHLGLQCDYKRPMWWSNSDQRKQQKDAIKAVIKRTQLTKKTTQPPPHPQPVPSHVHTPPSLCNSLPTTGEIHTDSLPQSRANSISSPYPHVWDVPYGSSESYFGQVPSQPHSMITPAPYHYSPYEVDIKTERQIFVNDVPTRKDSTISTFCTFQPPPHPHNVHAFPPNNWFQPEFYETQQETLTEEPIDFNFYDYSHEPTTPDHETVINVEDCDQYLLNHFIDKVLKLIFPILDANQHGSARADVILPALESNRAYLHCCLSIAATHMKATEHLPGEQIDNDIVRHRYAAISELCEALNQDVEHARILEATLGMIFFQCSVGRPDDALPDIPWHQHFQAAISLVHKLDLPKAVMDLPNVAGTTGRPPFNMALTSWIDILGSTMLGRAPVFADTYRELNSDHKTAGLAELMGCEDRIMFLISEVACLEVSKTDGLDEVMLCRYVEMLAAEIGKIEMSSEEVQSCFSPTGAIRPRQLNINISAIFCVATRIYLCALVPGFEPRQPSMCHLISKFSDLMRFIPAGIEGFDRSLVWPLLVAGSMSMADSPFRGMFAERCERLGEAAKFGSIGRVSELLHEVWQMNDDDSRPASAVTSSENRAARWREVMRRKHWDCLLI